MKNRVTTIDGVPMVLHLKRFCGIFTYGKVNQPNRFATIIDADICQSYIQMCDMEDFVSSLRAS